MALAATAAFATSFVRVSDRDLTAQAAVVAEVSVVAAGPGTAARPATDYLVAVERVLKGDVPGSRLVVRVPGGVGADGIALKVWGAPELATGERALLFLTPQPDGSYGILHLMLGAFHIVAAAERDVAVRDLSGASELRLDGTPVAPSGEPLRDLERFAGWIGDPAGPADYLLDSPAQDGPRSVSQPSTELLAGDGLPIRWFVFDTGGHVDWQIDPAGQPGLGATASLDAFRKALADWSSDPTSSIDYELAGTAQGGRGLTGPDGVNAILFGDPGNASVPGAFSCKTGGVLAMGGPFYSLSPRQYNGRTYHEAIEADVVTNDGADCFFRNNPTGAEEVFAHELGHTLGLGHSADPEALMFAVAHDDGRGGRAASDDRLAVNLAYGDGQLKIAPPLPPGKLLLAAQPARTQVDLTWTGSPGAADCLIVEIKVGRTFRTLMSLPPGVSSAAVQGLRPNSSYFFRLTAKRGKSPAGSSNIVAVHTMR